MAEGESPISSAKYNEEIDNLYLNLNRGLSFHSGSVPPDEPLLNQYWLDTGTTPSVLRRYDGSVWLWTGIYFGSAAPANPAPGAFFINSAAGTMAFWDDGASEWVSLPGTAIGFDPGETDLTSTNMQDALQEMYVSYTLTRDQAIAAIGAAADAGLYAGQADAARIAAQTAQGLSEGARDAALAAQGLAEGARDSSQAAQGLSEEARDAALAAQGLAESARDKAFAWAEAGEDVAVEEGLFSARHWALKSYGYATVGPQGPPGPVGINWQGEWSSLATYNPLDAVSYGGQSWIANAATGETPGASADWDIIAVRGTSLIIKGGKASEAEILAITGAEAGDAWINTATGDLYVWNASSGTWDNVGRIVGPEGPQGPVGIEWRGDWSAGTYQYRDAVAHGKQSWVANKETTEEPSLSSPDWDLMAAAGVGGYLEPGPGNAIMPIAYGAEAAEIAMLEIAPGDGGKVAMVDEAGTSWVVSELPKVGSSVMLTLVHTTIPQSTTATAYDVLATGKIIGRSDWHGPELTVLLRRSGSGQIRISLSDGTTTVTAETASFAASGTDELTLDTTTLADGVTWDLTVEALTDDAGVTVERLKILADPVNEFSPVMAVAKAGNSMSGPTFAELDLSYFMAAGINVDAAGGVVALCDVDLGTATEAELRVTVSGAGSSESVTATVTVSGVTEIRCPYPPVASAVASCRVEGRVTAGSGTIALSHYQLHVER